MKWAVHHRVTREPIGTLFEDRDTALAHISKMGSAFVGLFEAIPKTDDPWHYRILTEGLVAGDLRRIILPQISIDEYVPGDPDTDNIVIAFFIRGVPEAVIPFRDFVMKCKGVVDIAYGDSDTVPDTSIVYAEMVRKDFRFENLNTIMEQIGLLSSLEPSDFTVIFPTSSKRYPYEETVIIDYFASRSDQDNWEDQQKAIEQSKNEEDPEQSSPEEERSE
jgi:hypothetical protein